MMNAETLEGSLRRALAYSHAALDAGEPQLARAAVAVALHELAHGGRLSLTLQRARTIAPLVSRLRDVLESLASTERWPRRQAQRGTPSRMLG